MTEAEFRDHLLKEGYGEAALVEWDANTVNDQHAHEFDASVFVLSGELSVTTENGDKTTCRANDTFSLLAGRLHTEVTGAQGVRFLAGRR